VETGQLIPLLTVFRLEKLEERYDEPHYPARKYGLITALGNIGHFNSPPADDLKHEQLPLLDPEQANRPIYEPVSRHRGAYLPLGNDIDYLDRSVFDPQRAGAFSKPLVLAASIPVSYPSMMQCINQYELFMCNIRIYYNNRRKPFMARVVRKSSVHHYGRVDKTERFPFSMELELCDSSRRDLSCIIWNFLVFKYFPVIQCGQLVLINDYRVKDRYLSGGSDIEISINHNPQSSKSQLNPISLLHGKFNRIVIIFN
jgi:hypothetical protein